MEGVGWVNQSAELQTLDRKARSGAFINTDSNADGFKSSRKKERKIRWEVSGGSGDI